MAKKTLLGWFS